MGDHKKTHCLYGGHLLTPPNLCYNSLGYRECRKCKYIRAATYRATQRARRLGAIQYQPPAPKPKI